MRIGALPSELCLLIVDDLPFPDLYNLFRTCRGMSHFLTPRFHELGLRDRGKLTALQWAAKRGHESLVELAIFNGANVYETTNCKYGLTPLHLAAGSKKPNPKVIETLVKHGAPIDARDSKRRTPLLLATCSGSGQVVEVLLRLGASMKEEYRIGHIAAVRNDVGSIRAFIAAGFDLQARGKKGRTILHEALSCPSTGLETARYILGLEGVMLIVNAETDAGSTPLHCLLENFGKYRLSDTDKLEKLEMVQLLLQRGADVQAKDKYGETPAHIEAESGDTDSMSELIRAGFDINTKGAWEGTVLHRAVRRPEMMKYFLGLEGGRLGINTQDLSGRTPLHIAVAVDSKEVVELLLRHRADPEIEDQEGVSPSFLAHRWGSEGVAKAFIDAGAEFDFGDMLHELLENPIAVSPTVTCFKSTPPCGRNGRLYNFGMKKIIFIFFLCLLLLYLVPYRYLSAVRFFSHAVHGGWEVPRIQGSYGVVLIIASPHHLQHHYHHTYQEKS